MISPNDANKGLVFKHEGKLVKILDKHHVKLSKGGACQQAKCIDLKTGSTFELRLNVNQDLEQVYINKKSLDFIGFDGDTAKFFDTEDYTQSEINPSDLGEKAQLFSIRGNPPLTESGDNIKLQIEYIEENGSIFIIESKILNQYDIVFEVQSTAPSIKGEMAKPSNKPAILRGGLKVDVPPHVETGDKIILNKTNLAYEGKSR
jgi:elongation factor P